MASKPRLILRAGKEKSLLRRHPWIFSGAVERLDGHATNGDTVEVRSPSGQFLGWAACNTQSRIVGRVWSFDERERIDADFFRRRLESAIALRNRVMEAGPGQAVRLVHGESDGLPGVVVDRYATTLVLQLSSAGGYHWRDTLVKQLASLLPGHAVFERSDADVLQLEGLQPQIGLRAGQMTGTSFDENGLVFEADPQHGHKTGFYLDQRDNRLLARSLAHGREALDCFCYSGGFTVSLLAGGAASVLSIDSSADALRALQVNVARNALAAPELLEADVFQMLRKLRDQGRQFDLIVLDPPKFAPTAALAERAARGYKDINLYAFKLLRPGGWLLTFSCSGGVSPDLFQKIVAGAALDAGVDARILRRLGAAPDHPVALHFPEGEYLKGLLVST
jgi:23S rRNA (cytosine1962-C5)-methyltransferase